VVETSPAFIRATPPTAEVVALLQCSAQYNEGLAGYGSNEY
jgi:hypothetical protein